MARGRTWCTRRNCAFRLPLATGVRSCAPATPDEKAKLRFDSNLQPRDFATSQLHIFTGPEIPLLNNAFCSTPPTVPRLCTVHGTPKSKSRCAQFPHFAGHPTNQAQPPVNPDRWGAAAWCLGRRNRSPAVADTISRQPIWTSGRGILFLGSFRRRRQDAAVKFDPSISLPFVCGNQDEARRGEATEHKARDPAHHSLQDLDLDLDLTNNDHTLCSICREERLAWKLDKRKQTSRYEGQFDRQRPIHPVLQRPLALSFNGYCVGPWCKTIARQTRLFKSKPANQGLSVVRHSTDPGPVPTGEQAAGIPLSQDFRKDLDQVLEGRGTLWRT
ncbi:hypothetical protein CORC01_07554 [Colletotrichum orchidophilum]|uniref:Uncharacterized protein n=1 Tax=Colletotrichum orchidophilum TaxID=1209926 RepID=A0A1G4B731_9PEZI|nr:uncharacterized protein CORC01_07554 [Colletotrichum orchidophilum]OHE97113.1 hypothetical protein CORC01_07554 [Colletotrichum orchidophilum]